ncbi:hypothetical protein E2562_029127 [Oryza meyeriana var. granulata]|uniref:Uncharacterized protein n=1 Tax=Oryza meyeriana var. granulata TaxID=110450 RepID=A0A6G1ECB8_9ORYZ|nr:hypothetical protein E2562_029127 [Oryza meyeriana var. granulata]
MHVDAKGLDAAVVSTSPNVDLGSPPPPWSSEPPSDLAWSEAAAELSDDRTGAVVSIFAIDEAIVSSPTSTRVLAISSSPQRMQQHMAALESPLPPAY